MRGGIALTSIIALDACAPEKPKGGDKTENAPYIASGPARTDSAANQQVFSKPDTAKNLVIDDKAGVKGGRGNGGDKHIGGGNTGGGIVGGGNTGGGQTGGGNTGGGNTGGGKTGGGNTGGDDNRPRSLTFASTPSGATVVIRDARTNQVVQTTKTPASLTLARGHYTWAVDLPGYVPEDSKQSSIDLYTESSANVSVNLVAVDSRQIIARANALVATSPANCSEAIKLYDGIPQPNEVPSNAGNLWLEARLRSAQCERARREWDNAIRKFEQITAAAPGQWTAKYELGRTYCDAKSFNDGKRTLGDLEGPFLGQVSSDRKLYVKLLAAYGKANCKYLDYSNKSQPERFGDLREEYQSGFEEFIATAEKLDRIPDDFKALVSSALADARKKLK